MKYLLVNNPKQKHRAHIWQDNETLCRMASTGGLRNRLRCKHEATMSEQEDVTWAIYRLSDKGHYLGQVSAPDENTAIKIAIQEFQITNPHHQARLVARRAG